MVAYSETYLDLVFSLVRQIPGRPGFGYDCDNRIICRTEYGLYSTYGWHVDHIVPTILGGDDGFINHRPRHWQGNTAAGGLLGGILSGNSGFGR